MDRFDKNNVGAHIYENLESLTENELLELSQQLDEVPMPMVEGALDEFRREYLPTACEVSLYDLEKEVVRMKRTNIKTLLIAAMITVMMIVSSMVSFAAGAASNGNKGAGNSNVEGSKEPLRTTTTINGITGELFIVRPIENFDFESYRPTQDVIEQVSEPYIYNTYHFVDEDGNILEFEQVKITDEMRAEANNKTVEKFGEKASGYQIGDVIGEAERSQITFSVHRAGEYYYETLTGFTHDRSKVFAYFDTNFQIESTVTIYAYCYNAELDIYQEFLTSRTHMGGFDISFEPQDGWEIIEREIIISNPLVGRAYMGYNADKYTIETSEDISAFREMINEALEKHQKEKEEKNDIINKIESNQNK